MNKLQFRAIRVLVLTLVLPTFSFSPHNSNAQSKSAPKTTSTPTQGAIWNLPDDPNPLSYDERARLLDSEGYGVPLSAQPINGDTLYALCVEGGVQFSSGLAGSDCWGYVAPDGTEYAIMGMFDGVVFVDVTNMRIVDTIAQLPCAWRDMVTYQNYCYAVMDCADFVQGVFVIDMQFLPDSVHLVRTFQTNDPAHGFFQGASHNLAVDSIQGFLYVEGWCGCNGWQNTNIFIHDLSDPSDPTYVTSFSNVFTDVHDMYAYDDTVWVADGWTSSFTVWDMADKFNPQIITSWVTPSGGFTHNIWLSDDRQIAATTEETPGRTVKIWDVSDLLNVQLLSEYLAPAGLAHNAHIKGDRLYLSHYESGLRVLDISDPANPVEIGVFDTHPGEAANFAGAWGVYPHSPNDLIFISNMDERLIVLREKTAIINDTLFIDNAGAPAGTQATVDVIAANSQFTRQFIIPFSWAGPANLILDSASTVGLRTEFFEEVNLVSINPFAKEAAYSLVSSNAGTAPDLDPGSGPILTLYFTVPPGAADAINPIVFKNVNGTLPAVRDECGLIITPDTTSGSLEICAGCGSCCLTAGDSNHDSSVNVADVTFMIARIFAGGTAPVCATEADANGDGKANIADVTYLIARIFASGPEPVCGMAGA